MPKRATRTVKVTYVDELDTRSGQAVYDLPLEILTPLQEFSLNLSVDVTNAGTL